MAVFSYLELISFSMEIVSFLRLKAQGLSWTKETMQKKCIVIYCNDTIETVNLKFPVVLASGYSNFKILVFTNGCKCFEMGDDNTHIHTHIIMYIYID